MHPTLDIYIICSKSGSCGCGENFSSSLTTDSAALCKSSAILAGSKRLRSPLSSLTLRLGQCQQRHGRFGHCLHATAIHKEHGLDRHMKQGCRQEMHRRHITLSVWQCLSHVPGRSQGGRSQLLPLDDIVLVGRALSLPQDFAGIAGQFRGVLTLAPASARRIGYHHLFAGASYMLARTVQLRWPRLRLQVDADEAFGLRP